MSRRRPNASALAVGGAFVALALGLGGGGGGCLPGSGPPLLTPEATDAAPPTDFGQDDGGAPKSDVDLGDPFAITGLTPSHGPYTGGTRAEIRGRGFGSKIAITVGGGAVDPTSIVASDPTRAVIVTPPGKPGPADVRVKNLVTAEERVLAGGFTYDAFVVTPSSGSITGGTHVALEGSGTAFASGATVSIDGKPCSDVSVASGTHLECTTPPGSLGPKDVTVTLPGGAVVSARDAYTYSDGVDGYRGGFSGGALAGHMKVLVLDQYTGIPIPQAKVIGGAPLASAVVATTDAAGVAELTGAQVTGALTVTVAGTCHQPTTFVDVPVDTLTAYVAPVIDIACATQGDPPSSGGGGGVDGGVVEGQLIWSGGIEFKRAGWGNVPLPVRPTERLAAYVFLASGSPLAGFYLPAPSAATTPDSPGVAGYGYSRVSFPGNETIYALAGIEDTTATARTFTAYAMGVARGVDVQPGTRTTGVDILMNTLLDHVVTMNASPPAPGPRGPDRFVAQLGVSLGVGQYATLPTGSFTAFLPFQGTASFVGVPALDGSLTGEAYVVGAQAYTGNGGGPPLSVVARVRTTDANAPVTLGGFLAPPEPVTPGAGTWDGKHVSVTASGAYDLMTLAIESGGGLVTWTMVAPGGKTSWEVPDLAQIPSSYPLGLQPGSIKTRTNVARIDEPGFTYAQLRTGHLYGNAWSAYAYDELYGGY